MSNKYAPDVAQAAGLAAAAVGCWLLAGLAVTLVVVGLAVVAAGVVAELRRAD